MSFHRYIKYCQKDGVTNLTNISATPSRMTQCSNIAYKGHNFTMFDTTERHLILKYLLEKCHSLELLREESTARSGYYSMIED